jgi:type II secretory pathway component PulF
VSRFAYTARLTSGQRVVGKIRSSERRDALRRLLELGYHPIALVSSEAEGAKKGLFRRGGVGLTHVAILTRQLSVLLKAGMTLVNAIDTLRQHCSNRRLTAVLGDVRDLMTQDATTFGEALSNHPVVFDAVYCGLVRAGEESGSLPEVLAGLANHLTRSARLRGQTINAFIYPVFLLLLGATAVLVLMTFVIPRFQELFASFERQLPLPTRMLIATSDFLATWWWVLLLALVAAAGIGLWALRRERVRRRVDAFALRLPVLGGVFLKLELSRISRTLAQLMDHGVRILEALKITTQTARNLSVKETFAEISRGVSQGRTLAEGLANAKLYPPIMVNLVRTGEETGALPEMLSEVAAIYEEEAERSVSGAVKLLEPILILAMGLIIAGIVAAVMLPVFQANVMTQ